ncbi:redoxin domain-containing protein [Kribbella qitaiheensis]|uniref:Redoxin domain-containing protein n=1 Tax=Kribbella qitaiheensis TaxID=1544730 RepID=A0A7G6X9F9_9ACTN|nr:redoxin domain-containing protein [Kribbella qitaiheensis]
MRQLAVGDLVTARSLTPLQGEMTRLPDPAGLVHLQFRRYAGCPICNLHLRQTTQRHAEIAESGVTQIVVFHSTETALRRYGADRFPFAVIADPTKNLYAEFKVEASPHALLHPRAWLAYGRSVTAARSLKGTADRGEQHLGLPADFLIGSTGLVLARKYGRHAADQWSVDELLDLTREHPV